MMGLVTAQINQAKLELERRLQIEIGENKGNQQSMQMAVASVDNQQQGIQARIRYLEDKLSTLRGTIETLTTSNNKEAHSRLNQGPGKGLIGLMLLIQCQK